MPTRARRLKPKRKYARPGKSGRASAASGTRAGSAALVADLVDSDGLTLRERAFAAAYLSNGFNGAQAWHAVFTTASPETCRAEGSACLARPNVNRFVKAQASKWFAAQGMSGIEALGRVAQAAKSDIRELFDETGQALPPHRWPDTITNSIEGFELTKDGYRVKLVSKLAAWRIVLEHAGVLRNPESESIQALARAIRGDLALPEP